MSEKPVLPPIDDIVAWFNRWMKEPINDRERVIIESMEYVVRYGEHGIRDPYKGYLNGH